MSELIFYLNCRMQFLQGGTNSQDSCSWDQAQKILKSYPPYKSYAASGTAFSLIDEVAQKAVDSAKVEDGKGVNYVVYELSWAKYLMGGRFASPIKISISVAHSKTYTARFNGANRNSDLSNDNSYDPFLDPNCVRPDPSQLRYDTAPR